MPAAVATLAFSLVTSLVLGQTQAWASASAWHVLRAAHDTDGDGRIAADEYGGEDQTFRRLDDDGDGWITEADLASPARSRHATDSLMGDIVGWLADHDNDHAVSGAEWESTIAALDPDGDGVAGREALSETGLGGPMLGGIVGMLDGNEDRQLQVTELEHLFRHLDKNADGLLGDDELVSWRGSHLKVGDPAPLFELPTVGDPDKIVRLADFRGQRPVALIFGSYT